MLFLVVDDDELSRELVALLLGTEGHQVEVAASGDEALARLGDAERSCPEVVLSDMQMPGLSGAALALALRRVAVGRMKMLAMSGSQPGEAALSGFDGFLLKPFSMETLYTALGRTQERLFLVPGVADSGTVEESAHADGPLNETIYEKMAQMVPEKQLAEMYAMCLADARQRLMQMGKLAETGDDEGFRRAAHTVKGGCGMIGATELYKLAEKAEAEGLKAVSGSLPAFPAESAIQTSRVAQLLEHFSSACDRLERIVEERNWHQYRRMNADEIC